MTGAGAPGERACHGCARWARHARWRVRWGDGSGGAGAGSRGEEDREHQSPEYLRTYHDFWDDLPPVAPPAIGEDDNGTGTDNEGDGGGTH